MAIKLLALGALAASLSAQQSARPLFNGKNLDGWEVKGDGSWTVLPGGVLLAQATSGGKTPFGPWPVTLTEKQYLDWRQTQSWLYTTAEFGAFELHLEYFAARGGNSGVSLRDATRGQYSYGGSPDFNRTPAHNGYEIQLYNGIKTKYPSGSIYLFAPAEFGHEKESEWNSLDIESGADGSIRVKLNGHAVASFAGDPARPKRGPIGLQLHDRFSTISFRNIRIKEK